MFEFLTASVDTKAKRIRDAATVTSAATGAFCVACSRLTAAAPFC